METTAHNIATLHDRAKALMLLNRAMSDTAHAMEIYGKGKSFKYEYIIQQIKELQDDIRASNTF